MKHLCKRKPPEGGFWLGDDSLEILSVPVPYEPQLTRALYGFDELLRSLQDLRPCTGPFRPLRSLSDEDGDDHGTSLFCRHYANQTSFLSIAGEFYFRHLFLLYSAGYTVEQSCCLVNAP